MMNMDIFNDISMDKTEKLHKLLSLSSRTVLVTHVHPDGDALGCTLGLAGYLHLIGKKCTILTPDGVPPTLEFILPEDRGMRPVSWNDDPQSAEQLLNSCDLLVMQDLNGPGRADTMEGALRRLQCPKVLIDHHKMPERDFFDIVFSETEISSASELTFSIIKTMPETEGCIDRLPAWALKALMTGMTTDTNNFANSTYPSTMLMASELIASGVDRDEILSNINNSYRENRIRLMGYLLSERMKITPDGVAYIILDGETMKRYDVREGETEGFVNIALSIKEVKLSIFVKDDGNVFRFSSRSKKGTSARLCAERYFNGGGHELAAGGRMPLMSVDEAAAYIEEVTHKFMNGNEE